MRFGEDDVLEFNGDGISAEVVHWKLLQGSEAVGTIHVQDYVWISGFVFFLVRLDENRVTGLDVGEFDLWCVTRFVASRGKQRCVTVVEL